MGDDNMYNEAHFQSICVALVMLREPVKRNEEEEREGKLKNGKDAGKDKVIGDKIGSDI